MSAFSQALSRYDSACANFSHDKRDFIAATLAVRRESTTKSHARAIKRVFNSHFFTTKSK